MNKRSTDSFSSPASPCERASLVSRLLFLWVTPLLRLAKTRSLKIEDTFPNSLLEQSNSIAEHFRAVVPVVDSEMINESSATKRAFCFLLDLLRLYPKTLWLAVFCSIGFLFGLIVGPLLIRELVTILSIHPVAISQAVSVGILSLAVSIVTALAANQLFFQILQLMARWRAGITMLIFEKALRISADARLRYTTGEVVSLVTTHLQRIIAALNFIFSLWLHPVQIMVTIVLLYYLVGVSGLIGAGTLAATMSLSFASSTLAARFRARATQAADGRLGLLAEILAAIRTVKMYGWELVLGDEVQRRRLREEQAIRKLAWVRAGGNTIAVLCPTLAILATLGSATLLNVPLAPGTIFAIIGLLLSLRIPVTTLPDVVNQWVQAFVHIKAIHRFLKLPETKPLSATPVDPTQALEIRNGLFRFDSGQIIFTDLSLTIPEGSSVSIVAPVGAGKSTLLRIISGELELTDGSIARRARSIGYVPQVPWIANDTVRENILFGSPYNEERFASVLTAAHLGPDVAVLPHGIETQIGERGVNLSGGQRQRVAIARALYSDATLLVLDDPFSALDPLVGAAVAKSVFKGKLVAGRTIIVATHQPALAALADRSFSFQSGALAPLSVQELATIGRVTDSEAASVQGCAANDLQASTDSSNSHLMAAADSSLELVDSGGAQSIIVAEEQAEGAVERSIWRRYFADFLRGPYLALILLPFVVKEVLALSNDITITRIATAKLGLESLPVVGYFVAALIVVLLFRTFGIFSRGAHVASLRHQELLKGVLRSPVTFFDRNPIGRVLNRFSNDMQQLDETVPSMLLEALNGFFLTAGVLVLACFMEPWLVLCFAGTLAVLLWARGIYMAASRDTQRLDSIMKSPVLSLVSEGYSGGAVIAAFDRSRYFKDLMLSRLENATRANQSMVAANRWVGVWIEVVSVLISASILAFAITNPSELDPVLVGLVLTYGLTLTGTLTWLIRTTAMLENGLTAAERVDFYAGLQPERYESQQRPILDGAISIEQLSLRYRPDLPFVLSNFSLQVRAGEHIGIVGRTGSGKSTILQALLRLVEPSAGRVCYSGIDARDIDLTFLRRSVSLIPQEPVTFSGTVHFNVDPLGESSKAEVQAALTRVGLYLDPDFMLAEGGTNISFGERQLLCLVRALLRRSKILLLDEATSGTDRETDARIQELLKREFADCTIIAIAHRRETLQGYDRIISLSP